MVELLMLDPQRTGQKTFFTSDINLFWVQYGLHSCTLLLLSVTYTAQHSFMDQCVALEGNLNSSTMFDYALYFLTIYASLSEMPLHNRGNKWCLAK